MRHSVRLTAGLISLFSSFVSAGQDEAIGSVRQLYDGKLDPQIQVNTARNTDRLFPTRVVAKAGEPVPLPRKDAPFDYFDYEQGEETYDLYDYLSLGRVGGLLVLHDGEIAYEGYFLGNNDETRWMSMSIAKSITALLIGAAIKDGYIRDINDPVVDYLPQLKSSAYDGVTVRQILQMNSGVAWNETYTDPDSDRRAMLDAQILQEPDQILGIMAKLPRAHEPGKQFNYSTGETHVAGALLAAATGLTLSEYLSQKMWGPAGMESDATWWLESAQGLEVGGSGLSATLRDYGRVGQFMLMEGQIGDKAILPEKWMGDATQPQMLGGDVVPYGYMLWIMPDDAYAAVGIFGQWIYVNPKRKIVIVMWSAQPKPVGRSGLKEEVFLTELAAAVDRFYASKTE